MNIIKVILPIIFFSCNLFSQNFSVAGKVTDENSNSLTGVNVILTGTNYGDATDENGNYKISNIPSGNYIIKFSAIGYQTLEENISIINSSININAVLKEEVIEQEQVVVTATKYEKKKTDLPVSVEIIPAETIEERNIVDIEDALRYVPGVNLVDDQISIRGSSGYSRGAGTRVLMAIDGIPYYTGDTGEIIWESIPVADVDRVEVIKGAASSLYGSTALGGVVNIITNPISAKPITYFKTFFGAYDNPSYEIWKWSNRLQTFNGQTVTHSNRFGDFGVVASLTRLEDLGYRQDDFFKRYIGYLKLDYNFDSTSSIKIFGNSLNQKSGNFIYWKDSRNVLIPPESDQGQTVESNRYFAGLIFNKIFSRDFYLNFKGSFYRTDWMDESTSMNSSQTNLYRGELQVNKKFNNSLMLVSGIESSTSKVNSNLFGNPDAFEFGAYSQLDYNFNFPLTITAGVRYDYTKLDTIDESGEVSPRFGINYKFKKNLIFRSSIGTGFRAPSLAEAFTSTTTSGITVRPNPNIKPERNFTFEAGIYYAPFKEINFDLALFQNEFYDFIEPELRVDNSGSSYAIFDNITRARLQGFEFNSNYKLLNNLIDLSLNYTYLWSRDLEKHKALKYRPRHLFYAFSTFNINPFTIGVDFRFWSRIEEIDQELADLIIPDGEKRVPVYILDFRASYKFAIQEIPFRILLNAKNILNYYYVELIGNLAPIRNYSLSLELYL